MNQPPNPDYSHEPSDRPDPSGLPDPSDRDRPDASEPPAGESLKVTQTREEAEQLRREAHRLKVAQRRALFARITDGITLLTVLLEVLLGLRFFLRLSGANPENLFAKTIYNISEPFAAPFATLFISPTRSTEATIGKNIFDINLLIAMIVYVILASAVIWIVRYVQKQVEDSDS